MSMIRYPHLLSAFHTGRSLWFQTHLNLCCWTAYFSTHLFFSTFLLFFLVYHPLSRPVYGPRTFQPRIASFNHIPLLSLYGGMDVVPAMLLSEAGCSPSRNVWDD